MINEVNFPDDGEWIRNSIVEFFGSSANTSENSANDRLFDVPIVGFASGDDSIFDEFKSDIGSFYLTPLKYLKNIIPSHQYKQMNSP